jgi:hypothetical protein
LAFFIFPMAERYRLEMVADWMGAGMAQSGHGLAEAFDDCRAWYLKNRDVIQLHAETRLAVEDDLGLTDRGWQR